MALRSPRWLGTAGSDGSCGQCPFQSVLVFRQTHASPKARFRHFPLGNRTSTDVIPLHQGPYSSYPLLPLCCITHGGRCWHLMTSPSPPSPQNSSQTQTAFVLRAVSSSWLCRRESQTWSVPGLGVWCPLTGEFQSTCPGDLRW